MTNEKKLLLIVLILVSVTAIAFALKAVVGIFKDKLKQPKMESKPVVTTNDSKIGKIAYANTDGVIVLNSDFSIYKFAKKDEWVGTIYAIGEQNYIVSGNKIVLQQDVYLQ